MSKNIKIASFSQSVILKIYFGITKGAFILEAGNFTAMAKAKNQVMESNIVQANTNIKVCSKTGKDKDMDR